VGILRTLKNIATAPIKLVARVAKSPAGKALGIVVKPVYETVVPDRVQKAVSRIAKLIPLAKLFKKEQTMNPFEKALRSIAEVVESVQQKEGTTEVVGEVVQLLSAAGDALVEFKKAGVEDRRAMVREALDNCIGEEPNALFGPTGSLVRFDIPFIGDEAATDLALGLIVKLVVKDAPEPEPK
jgi:hypothetical protein